MRRFLLTLDTIDILCVLYLNFCTKDSIYTPLMCVHGLKQAKRKISIVSKLNKNRRIWIKKNMFMLQP